MSGYAKERCHLCGFRSLFILCSQQEAKEAPAPKQIPDIEYTALKSKNEVLKSSLAFEKETGEKLSDKLVSEE